MLFQKANVQPCLEGNAHQHLGKPILTKVSVSLVEYDESVGFIAQRRFWILANAAAAVVYDLGTGCVPHAVASPIQSEVVGQVDHKLAEALVEHADRFPGCASHEIR